MCVQTPYMVLMFGVLSRLDPGIVRSRHLLRPSFKLMTTIASAIPRHHPERQTRDNKQRRA